MTVRQIADRPDESALRQIADHISDRAERHSTPVPTNDLRPPGYGGPQRDAINSVVDGIVNDICQKIADLRKTLDGIEQEVLEGAAAAKHRLQDHILVCVRVNDEITHMQAVIEEIKQQASIAK